MIERLRTVIRAKRRAPQVPLLFFCAQPAYHAPCAYAALMQRCNAASVPRENAPRVQQKASAPNHNATRSHVSSADVARPVAA